MLVMQQLKLFILIIVQHGAHIFILYSITAYKNPCDPSPCGPNSECHVVSDRAACSCSPGYLGSPPACRPECAVNSDCPANRACIGQKCKDPCVNSCGLDARCHVVGHNPICSCPDNLPEGDPFIRCYRKSKDTLTIIGLGLSKYFR